MLGVASVVLSSAALAQTSASNTARQLDRVVAAVGSVAITASDIEREYPLELFLDGKLPVSQDPGVAVLNQVRQRLIDRELLEEEVRADGIKVSPADPAVTARWNDLQKKFSSADAFASALKELGMSEDEVRAVLAGQEEILRLIDRRLRPEAVVEPSEIEAYYHTTLLPRLAGQGNQQPPPLSEVENRIREILVQQKIDGLLEDWLKRLRARGDVYVFGNAEVNRAP